MDGDNTHSFDDICYVLKNNHIQQLDHGCPGPKDAFSREKLSS